MKKFLANIFKTQTMRDMILVLSGSVLSSALGFVFVAISARKLGPSSFGIFTTMLSYVTFVAAIADIGVSQSLVKFYHQTPNDKEKKTWISNGLASVALTSIIIGFFASIIYQFILRALWRHDTGFFMILWTMIVAIAFNSYFIFLLQSCQKYFKRAIIDNLFSITRLIITFTILYFGTFGLHEAMLVIIFGFVMAIAMAFKISKEWFDFNLVQLSKLKELFSFSRWLAGANFFSNLYGKLDIMMLAWLISAYNTGIYSAAARFIIFFPLIVSSLSSVVSPRFAQFPNKTEMQKYFKKLVLISLLIAFGMSLLVIFARFIIIISYGDAFLAAIPIFQLLVLSFLPLILSVPATNAIVYFYKKPKIITKISLFQLIGLFIIYLLLIPKYQMYGTVLGLLIMNLTGMMGQYLAYFKQK